MIGQAAVDIVGDDAKAGARVGEVVRTVAFPQRHAIKQLAACRGDQ
jgi:hypothetical protein